MFPTAKTLLDKILEFAEDEGISIMDAAVHFSETEKIEIEFIAELIKQSDVIKSKVEEEAEALHFLKRKDRLVF
jgi:hypothetical protein